ncbi:MAG: hypothetical protein ACHREM_24030, partial [Polyangiales bacterium]
MAGGLLHSLWRLRSARDETFTLDTLVAHASPERRVEERLLFLVRLLRWVRSPTRIVDASTAPLTDAPAQHGRIRFLLHVLDRNEESKRAVSRTLRSIVRDTNALDLFSETGMPAQLDLFGELRERITQRLLPAALDIDDLAQLFDVLFPSPADARWIESIDTETALGVHALLLHDVRDDEGDWNSLTRGLDDALLYLASQVRASGMSKAIRERLGPGSVRRLPFFGLAGAVDDLLASKLGAESLDKKRSAVLGRVSECEVAVRAARAHLVETGVSVPITYQLTRLAAQLARVRDLVEVATDDRGTRTARFIARLVRQSHERRGVMSLLRESGELWALKVVERSAQTGEHYITRSRREYRQMLGMAALGGLLTGLTTIVKVMI